jgi:hypothetical protein
MNRSILFWLLLVAIFWTVAVCNWLQWRERPDAVTGVSCELSPPHQVIKVGDSPQFTVTLTNRGKQEVVLVAKPSTRGAERPDQPRGRLKRQRP